MRFILGLFLAVHALPPAVLAADGRIPVYQPTVLGAGGGTFYLTRDIVGPAGAAAITIAAHNVTLDLNGHTIYVGAEGTGVYAYAPGGRAGIRVTNGVIQGGRVGIEMLSNNGGEYVVDHLRVLNQQSANSFTYGIALWSNSGLPATHVRIHDNTITNVSAAAPSSARGIVVQNVRGGVIRDNQVSSIGSDGILVSGSRSTTVAHNTISDTGQTGIDLNSSDECVVAWNTVGQGQHGIYLIGSNRCSLDWNSVSNHTGKGFYFIASSGNVYSYNRLLGNGSNDLGGNVSAGGNNAGGANF